MHAFIHMAACTLHMLGRPCMLRLEQSSHQPTLPPPLPFHWAFLNYCVGGFFVLMKGSLRPAVPSHSLAIARTTRSIPHRIPPFTLAYVQPVNAQDKNPAPLNQLDFLMEETYTGLMEAGTLMETAQGQLAVATVKLSCDVQLMLLLIKWVAC